MNAAQKHRDRIDTQHRKWMARLWRWAFTKIAEDLPRMDTKPPLPLKEFPTGSGWGKDPNRGFSGGGSGTCRALEGKLLRRKGRPPWKIEKRPKEDFLLRKETEFDRAVRIMEEELDAALSALGRDDWTRTATNHA